MSSHFRGWVVNPRLLMYLVLIGNKEKGRKVGEFCCGRGGILGVL
jgi:hypothetical protein